MKKLIIAMMLALPMMCAAQEVLTPEQQLEQAQKQLKEAQEALAKAQEAKAKAEEQQAEVEKQKQQIEEQAARVKAEAERIKAEADKIKAETPTATKSGWTAPTQTPRKKTDVTRKENAKVYIAKDGRELKEDPIYLEGAVPVNGEGKVEFSLDLDVSGKSAAQLYDLAYAYLDTLTQDSHQVDETSRIVLVNKEEGVIVCVLKEWMVFRDNFFNLDRSEFEYQLVATAKDNHLNVTLGRIRYNYEPGRKTGFDLPAEEIITDKYGLNRKKTDLARIYGKFRKGTIDRKNQIFNDITAVVQ